MLAMPRKKSNAANIDFAEEVLERLSRSVPGVRSRKMFGGVGIYSGEQFFAIVAFEKLWFKVDDSNRGDYEAHEMKPFQPFPDRPTALSYFELPLELLDQPEELRIWASRSLSAARAAKQKTRQRTGKRQSPGPALNTTGG